MVRIRLRRQGAKKQPSYRVVVADSRSPRDGRFIENIGFYDPLTDPPTMRVDGERALYWLGQGAQPSEAVLRMLKKTGIWREFKGVEAEPEEDPGEIAALAEAEAEVAEESEAPAEEAQEPEVAESEDE